MAGYDAENLMAPDDGLETIREEWALAVGRFITSFTQIENWMHTYVRTFGSRAVSEATHDLRLNQRLSLVRAFVLDMSLVPQLQKRVDDVFAKIERLAKPRNLVAHNGVAITVREQDDGELVVRHELLGNRDPRKDVTIALLSQYTRAAREIDEELAVLYGALRLPENHLPRD
jgi:hypothetical protein